MGLSKYEKETIILTNEEDSYYNIYTFNQKLQKKLKVFAEKYPKDCSRIQTTEEEVKLISSRRDGCR